MKNIFYAVFAFCFFASQSGGQTAKPGSFKEIQDKYYAQWQGKSIEKGQGYSVFKRFEWFWEQRLHENQDMSNLPNVWEEWEKYCRNNAYKSGLRGSNDSGNWVALGPTTTSAGYQGLGRINNIVFHPTDSNTFWVCTPAGGLWKTTNFGQSWSNTTDYSLPMLGCSDMAVDYTNPNVLYLATGDRDMGSLWTLRSMYGSADTWSSGVMKSSDGGKTWRKTGLKYTIGTSFEIVNRILMHPTNHKILWAACSNGIYLTTDSGATWSNKRTGDFVDLELKPNNPNILYAGQQANSGGANMYRSTDGGLTWTQITSQSSSRRVNIEVSAADPNGVDMCMAKTDRGLLGLYYSSDSGATVTNYWDGTASGKNLLHRNANATGTGGQGEYDLAYALDPKNSNNIFIGGVNAWKSTNGGSSFSLMNYWTNGSSSPIVHADKHWMRFHPGSKATKGVLFESNDGGIYYSRDHGVNWVHITNGLQIGQIYRIGTSQTDQTLMIAGHQDNGTKVKNSGSFYDAKGGDGMECMVDHSNANYMYATSQYGDLARSNDKFNSNSVGITPTTTQGAWVTPLAMDPKAASTIWAGYDVLYKSTNRGSAWSDMGGPLTSGTYRHMFISPAISNVMLVGNLQNLWRSINGGSSWVKVNSGLPLSNGYITYACMSAADTATYWVTISNYQSGNKVYKTVNGGKSYTNISGSLPNVPVSCIAYENGSKNGLYIGTDLGVYYRNDNLTDWVYFSRKLPNMPVTDLEIQNSSKKIRAATFGRGLWESNLYTAQPQAGPKASFTADDTVICQGGTVNFKSTSTNSPTSFAWTFQGGSPFSGVDSTAAVQYNNPGTFIVRLIATNLGGTDTLQKNAHITVKANPPLPSIKETDTNHLSSNAKYGNQWIYNGTPITGAKDTFYKATQSGGYRVETTDSNGCKSISGTYTFKFYNIGLTGLADNLNLVVFPNPSKGVFNFTFNQNLNKACQIVIYDVNEKQIKQVQVNRNSTSIIDLSHEASGIYLLEVKDGEQVLGHSKLLVEH